MFVRHVLSTGDCNTIHAHGSLLQRTLDRVQGSSVSYLLKTKYVVIYVFSPEYVNMDMAKTHFPDQNLFFWTDNKRTNKKYKELMNL